MEFQRATKKTQTCGSPPKFKGGSVGNLTQQFRLKGIARVPDDKRQRCKKSIYTDPHSPLGTGERTATGYQRAVLRKGLYGGQERTATAVQAVPQGTATKVIVPGSG